MNKSDHDILVIGMDRPDGKVEAWILGRLMTTQSWGTSEQDVVYKMMASGHVVRPTKVVREMMVNNYLELHTILTGEKVP